MAESFVLFDDEFMLTNRTDGAKYIVITDTTKAIDDDELYNYWFDSDCPTEEVEDIGHYTYYYWEDDYERYLPIIDDKIIEKLDKAMESCCSESNKANSSESESAEVNNTNSTPKKYKLYITLENGTIIEPNFTSDNPADFAEMIEVISSELYFAGNIKSIKIE